MILNNTQITWKLKEGIVLKYGPAPESYEENSSLSESGSVNEVPESETFIQDEVQSAELIMPVENTPNPVSSSPDVKEDKAVSGDTPKSNVEQSYPESVNHKLVNSSNSCPVVDGIAVHIPPSGVSLGARWQSLPYRLRAKRADVFVDFQSSVDYLNSLVTFLRNKGLDVKEYNDEVHYLPSDIILADASRLIDAGTVLVLQRGKRYVWEALLKEFGARLNGKQ